MFLSFLHDIQLLSDFGSHVFDGTFHNKKKYNNNNNL